MREEEQVRLRQRNAELENLVQELQARLQVQAESKFSTSAHVRSRADSADHTADLPDLRFDVSLHEARYSSIVEHHPDLICCFLSDGTLTYINQAGCRYFGSPQAALLGKNFLHLVTQSADAISDLPSSLHSIKQLRNGYEHRGRSAEGKICWHCWSSQPIRASSGITIELQAVGQDITDRKRLEAFLQQHLLKLNASSHSQAEPPNVMSSAAQLHAEILHPLVGHSLRAEETTQTCHTSIARILERFFLFDESGQLVPILSLVQNITQRTQAAEELRESEERFRQLAENIQQIFWMYEVEERKLIYISPACEPVLGYSSASCYSTSSDFWLSCVHVADRHLVAKAMRQVVRGKPAEAMCRFTTADGSERWLLTRAFPVRNQQGKVYRIAGIAEDITDRRQQEQRLRLLESVVVNANDGVVITEAEPIELPGPKIVYVNQAFTDMMGYESDEVVGQTPRIFQGAKTDWDVLRRIRTALKRWEPSLVELVNYHKDGSEVWIELSMFPVTDQIGQYTYWVGLRRDITQRKKTEATLQLQTLRSQLFADITLKIRQSLQLEEILQTTVTEVRNLLQADRVLIYQLSPDKTGFVSNEAVTAERDSLLGKTYPVNVFFANYPQKRDDTLIQTIEDREAEDLATLQFLREIGVRARVVVPIVQQDCLWGLLIAHQCDQPRQWSSFEIELLQQLANQVEIALTQSQLLQALRESEERFRTMANSAPVLLWVIDKTGSRTFCNQSLLDFTGRTIEQDCGLGWYETVHPADLQHCKDTYHRALTHCSSFEIEYRLRRADGNYRWVLDRGVPRFTPDGSFSGHTGSCIDITERVRVENERKQAEIEVCKALTKERELSELKSRFVSTASHEFRTPLSTILSSADLLEFYAGGWSPEKQVEHIQRIQNAALNMNNLLSDILVIERAEANKLQFEPTAIDLYAFCQDLIDEMQLNDQEEHRLILEVQKLEEQQNGETLLEASPLTFYPPGSISAHMDEKLLRQILSNLLSNALKYSSSGSPVFFRLTCDKLNACFEVHDRGIGIPPEDQARLFEPFHRGTNVGTTSGNGLGLAIVKQSVDAHRGQIVVSSREGVGTTVRVVLPLHSVADE